MFLRSELGSLSEPNLSILCIYPYLYLYSDLTFILTCTVSSTLILSYPSPILYPMDSSPSAKAMSLYIRVKRSNQTIFLHVEPMDTFQDVKGKLKVILYPPDGRDANEGLQLLKNENLTEDLPDKRLEKGCLCEGADCWVPCPTPTTACMCEGALYASPVATRPRSKRAVHGTL